MAIPGARKSPEDSVCRHPKTKWYGPFPLELGDKKYTYKQKRCENPKCKKVLKNSKPKLVQE